MNEKANEQTKKNCNGNTALERLRGKRFIASIIA